MVRRGEGGGEVPPLFHDCRGNMKNTRHPRTKDVVPTPASFIQLVLQRKLAVEMQLARAPDTAGTKPVAKPTAKTLLEVLITRFFVHNNGRPSPLH